jgi:putative transposase
MEVKEVDEAYSSKTSPLTDIFKVRKTKNTKLCLGKRKRNISRDFISGKIFHADLVGALNILRIGAKLLRLNFYQNLKVFFVKLCNPKRFKLIEFFCKVSPGPYNG